MIQEQKISIKIWLFLCILSVLSMVAIGGITRLTRSGLSITEWNFMSGILPPLNNKSWAEEFEKYKKIPEFKIINQKMDLENFKKIYLIEYFHRLLGRITGLVLFLPLLYFFIFKKIDKKFFIKNLLIFSLIGIQGTIGWFMVRSGLKDRISVNEFMLGFHLIFALLIFSLLSLEFFKLNENTNHYKNNKNLKINFFLIRIGCFFLIPVQIFLGGLVAGLHINGFCFENNHELCDHNPLKFIGLENLHTILNLFLHRNFAIFVFCFLILICFNNFRQKICIKESIFLILSLLTQMILGILALKTQNFNILFSSMHQINAFFIMFFLLKIFHEHRNILK